MVDEHQELGLVEKQYMDTCQNYEDLAIKYKRITESSRDALLLIRRCEDENEEEIPLKKIMELLSVVEEE